MSGEQLCVSVYLFSLHVVLSGASSPGAREVACRPGLPLTGTPGCKSVLHKKCTKGLTNECAHTTRKKVAGGTVSSTKDTWTRVKPASASTLSAASGRQASLYASQSVQGVNSPDDSKDSALQVTLENALMDALRLQSRITVRPLSLAGARVALLGVWLLCSSLSALLCE